MGAWKAICDHRTKKNQLVVVVLHKILNLGAASTLLISSYPTHGKLLSIHTTQLLSEETFSILTEENEHREGP